MQSKQSLRAALSRRIRSDRGSAVCARIAALPQWQRAQCVMAFYPLPSEPDIRPLLAQALAAGKTLLLPHTDADLRIHPCRVASLDALQPGRFGIPEPRLSDETQLSPELILIPAVAYDRCGNRLGHGAGCYDRFLPGCEAFRVGVCFDDCLLDAVPTDPHDLPVQIVCTEKQTVPNMEET